MRDPQFRRGIIAGVIIALVLAAALAARSDNQLETFLYILAAGLTGAAFALLFGVVIMKARQRR